jgi:hypothetical protein
MDMMGIAHSGCEKPSRNRNEVRAAVPIQGPGRSLSRTRIALALRERIGILFEILLLGLGRRSCILDLGTTRLGLLSPDGGLVVFLATHHAHHAQAQKGKARSAGERLLHALRAPAEKSLDEENRYTRLFFPLRPIAWLQADPFPGAVDLKSCE